MIKKELITAVVVAIIGTVIAFFICNIFMGEVSRFSFTSVDDSSINADLDEPDPEIFNYKAINPTVEVYVGEEEQ